MTDLSNNQMNKEEEKMKLGKLEEIDIRKVWQHEQYDFSQWLASEKSIQELGDILGLVLTDVETEKFVGTFRCDILCKDELSDKSVARCIAKLCGVGLSIGNVDECLEALKSVKKYPF